MKQLQRDNAVKLSIIYSLLRSPIVIGLVFVFLLCSMTISDKYVVYGATFTDVTDAATLHSLVEAGTNVRLLNNIVLDSSQSLEISHDVTIDLNGKYLQMNASQNMLGVEAGKYFKLMNGTTSIDTYFKDNYSGTIVLYKVSTTGTLWMGKHKFIRVDSSSASVSEGSVVDGVAVIGSPGQSLQEALADSTKFYSDIDSAINEIAGGQALFLLKDYNGDIYHFNDSPCGIRKPITVDLGGHSVNYLAAGTFSGGTLTFRNGTVKNDIDDCPGKTADSGDMIWENLTVKGKAFISGHNVVVKSGYYNAGAFAGENGTIVLEGGFYTEDPSNLVNKQNGYVVIPCTEVKDGVTYKYHVVHGWKVYYDPNGGDGSTYMVPYEETTPPLTLPNATRSGKLFDGWYKVKDSTLESDRVGGYGDPFTPTADTTLYAQWHTHSWKLEDVNTAGSTVASADTIAAYCIAGDYKNPCEYYGTDKKITLKISAPDTTVYNTQSVTASLTGDLSPISGVTVSDIQYINCDGTPDYNSKVGPANVGKYKAVVTAAYNGTTVTAQKEFEITKAALSITPVSQEITYGGTIQSSTEKVTVTGLAGTDILDAVALYTDNVELTESGTISITEGSAVIKSSDKSSDRTGNYSITLNTGNLVIKQAESNVIEYPIFDGELTYGDPLSVLNLIGGKAENPVNHNEISGSFTLEDDSICPKYSDSESTDYYVVFTPDDTVRYGGARFPIKVKVNKRELEIEWSDYDFTFDNKEHVPTATPLNLVTGDECSVSVSGAKTHACQTEGVTSYIANAAALIGTDSDNYMLPLATEPEKCTQAFIIRQKVLKKDMLDIKLDAQKVAKYTLTNDTHILTEGTDYTVVCDDSAKDRIVYTFEAVQSDTPEGEKIYSGDYKGKIVRSFSIPEGDGNITTYSQVDETASAYKPALQKMSESEGKEVLENELVKIGKSDVASKIENKDPSVDGYDAEIILTMKAYEEEKDPVPKKDAVLIEEGKAEVTGNKNVKVAEYLDLSVFLKYTIPVSGGAPIKDEVPIHDIPEEKKITINVPAALRNANPDKIRTFYVVREHDGDLECLCSGRGTTLTFSSRKFSTYALLYADTDAPKDPEPDDNSSGSDNSYVIPTNTAATANMMPLYYVSPKTSDTKETVIWITILAIGIVLLASSVTASRNSRKNNN